MDLAAARRRTTSAGIFTASMADARLVYLLSEQEAVEAHGD